MSIKRFLWILITALIAADFSLGALFVRFRGQYDAKTHFALGVTLIQLCALCFTVVWFIRYARWRRQQPAEVQIAEAEKESKRRWPIAVIAAWSMLSFLSVLRGIDRIAASGAGWHLSQILVLSFGLMFSIYLFSIAFIALRKRVEKS